MSERNGILAGGNFIVDYVKIIDAWPQQDTLASILSESRSNGGGPYNALKDLAALGVDFPLAAVGLVGDDPDGKWILADCKESGIDVAGLRMTSEVTTSYTDAMSDANTGRRTFFHQRGANADLDEADFDFSGRNEKVFLLGFLLLLDTLDKVDVDGRTGASRVLEKASDAGMRTAVELVSAQGKFKEIAMASLPFADCFLLNEFEAGQVLGREVESGKEALGAAAREISELGAKGDVVIHCPAGAVVATKTGEVYAQGSLRLPDGFIVGATGAGDAFTAGYLMAWHDDQPPVDRLRAGVCVAAASLSDPTPSGGVGSIEECFELAKRYGYRAY